MRRTGRSSLAIYGVHWLGPKPLNGERGGDSAHAGTWERSRPRSTICMPGYASCPAIATISSIAFIERILICVYGIPGVRTSIANVRRVLDDSHATSSRKGLGRERPHRPHAWSVCSRRAYVNSTPYPRVDNIIVSFYLSFGGTDACF